MLLSVHNFSCGCACNSYNIDDYYLGCNEFSYDFSNGTYLLQGEIDCGAWSFVNAISSNCKKKSIYSRSEVTIDGQILSHKKIVNLACYIHSKPSNNIFRITFADAINKSIRKYAYPLPLSELLELFKIPEHITQKSISELGMYYSCYLAMNGLICGKKVFTSAWQGQYGFDNKIINTISVALAQKGNIFIIPTSKHNVFNSNCTAVDMLSLFDTEIQKKYCEKSL